MPDVAKEAPTEYQLIGLSDSGLVGSARRSSASALTLISHRLKNPDDIDHFKRIISMLARCLLDQVTILASGEAVVFGSAFHVPARVQFDRPQPGP